MLDFYQSDNLYIPLAEKLRPKNIDDIIGQKHLVGENGSLRKMVEGKQIYSMLFWGPPGSGKTTLAKLISNFLKVNLISLSAIFSGIKDIREAVTKAKESKEKGIRTVLFIDEIHRFNKSQQDAFLPFVESGLITLIGATTENPSFEINSALLSRLKIYILEKLSDDELKELVTKVLNLEEYKSFSIEQNAIDLLIMFANGDARNLLNSLEIIFETAKLENLIKINIDFCKNIIGKNIKYFDKGEDIFYEQISALHKSVRGSHPNAALYWLCRMLDAGVDPKYLIRRIIRMAWEDVGLADPRAIQIANNAGETYERLGSPEGELALAQTVIYLSCAAKSNAGYIAYNLARDFIKKTKDYSVPLHLRNPHTKLMKELNYGKDYSYSHDEDYAYSINQKYMPDELEEIDWYKPVNRGLEIKIKEKLEFLKKLDEQKKNKKNYNK